MEKWTLGRYTRIIAVVSMIILLLVINVKQFSTNKSLHQLNELAIKQLDLSEDEINALMNTKSAIEKELQDIKLENEKLRSEITDLNTDNENLQILNSGTTQTIEKIGPYNSEEIIKDLLKHPELIPFDGVVGGTMFFNEADVLNDKWVYATYEDGHISGAGIFEYKVDQDNKIKWELVDSFLYK
ncbi:hypothetical protein [Chengkuizengella marina]|uniref:Uncharacterized protein n=1 Tax=Chengkuizengella marina TaxID=2507566 RepID=A0A6N9PX72_9BACL|nr:hypothetical protein [Chengkuizengella marina]NBI28101.1 hypothetical protein [Chengkuizengella marina]